MTDLTPSGDPIGPVVAGWTACERPSRTSMEGRYCRLVPLSAEAHGRDLFAAQALSPDGRMWTYMPNGPFHDLAAYMVWAKAAEASEDPMHFTVLDGATGKAVGTASYLRIDPNPGVIEVGYIAFTPLLQRTRASTEAMYLMMARVFDELGYRRYEWKCNALNAPSMAAAKRLGFTFEGIFRQATIIKGRNRDTAWFSILDSEWPAIKASFKAFLSPENFDAEGHQIKRLEALRSTAS